MAILGLAWVLPPPGARMPVGRPRGAASATDAAAGGQPGLEASGPAAVAPVDDGAMTGTAPLGSPVVLDMATEVLPVGFHTTCSVENNRLPWDGSSNTWEARSVDACTDACMANELCSAFFLVTDAKYRETAGMGRPLSMLLLHHAGWQALAPLW